MEAFHSLLDCVEPHLFVTLERSFNTTHLRLQVCLIKEIWISYQALTYFDQLL